MSKLLYTYIVLHPIDMLSSFSNYTAKIFLLDRPCISFDELLSNFFVLVDSSICYGYDDKDVIERLFYKCFTNSTPPPYEFTIKQSDPIFDHAKTLKKNLLVENNEKEMFFTCYVRRFSLFDINPTYILFENYSTEKGVSNSFIEYIPLCSYHTKSAMKK